MNSNTDAERSSGRGQTPGAQHTTSTAADRTVFQDRDGRELTLFRVADGAALPFLGYTESTISWGNSPTRTATHAGHVSIDVSAGVPHAQYYPRDETTVEGTPLAVSLTARVLDPQEAGYPDAPFVVRLVADDAVRTTHGSALPTAFDLVYWSLADVTSADMEAVATDGGSVVAPNLDAAVDYDALDADNDLEYLVRLARDVLDIREADTDTAAALWVFVEWLDEHRSRFYSDSDDGEAVVTDGGQDQDVEFVPADEQATDDDVREAVEAAERGDVTSPGPDGEWNPEPVSLREGETPDHDSHAARNLAQIKQGLEDDILEPEDLSAEQLAQLDLDAEEAETQEAEPRLIADGGSEVAPVCALENPGTDDERVVAHGMTHEQVEAWDLARFVIDRDSPHWVEDLADLSPGQSVPLDAEYEEVICDTEHVATDGGEFQTRTVQEADRIGSNQDERQKIDRGVCPECGSEGPFPVTDTVPNRILGGPIAQVECPDCGTVIDQPELKRGTFDPMLTLGVHDEVLDCDRGEYGEVREVVENARVGGGRTVDRLRIRWDSGEDEWFNRTWLSADAGREIVRVERDGADEETEVNIDVNE